MSGGKTHLIAGVFLLLFLVFAVPASAATITIDNSSSIAGALHNVGSGGTLILGHGIYFIDTEISLPDNVKIMADTSNGHSAEDTIIDAQGNSRIFNAGSYSLTLDSLTLRNGYVGLIQSGGAIYGGSADVSVASCNFINCTAGSGGAIYAETISVDSSAFTDCDAIYNGGAVYSDSADPSAVPVSVDSSSTFTGCDALNAGGAIYGCYGNISIDSSTFTDCSAGSGGAIYSEYGIALVDYSTFSGCSALAYYGGAIYSFSGITTNHAAFTSCSADYGGAIYDSSGTVSVDSSSFINCSSSYTGAAIYLENGSITISGSDFTSCTSEYGGVIYLKKVANTVTIASSTFTNCLSASSSGGAVYLPESTVAVTGSTFTRCSADSGGGGAIAATSSDLTIQSSTFSYCSASGSSGGAIIATACNLTIESSVFNNCSAYSSGGAIISYYGTIDISSSSFSGCSLNPAALSPSVWGAAVASGYSNFTMHYSRIFDSNTGGTAIANYNGIFDATNNWWGTNTDPSVFTSESVTYTPWLVLGAVADPAAVIAGETSVIRANMTYDVNGTDTSGGGLLPGGIPVAFNIASGAGSLSVTGGNITSGTNSTVFTAAGSGTMTINVTVDGQTLSVPVVVQSDSTSAPASSSSGGSSSSGSGGSNTDTGIGVAYDLEAGSSTSFDLENSAVYKLVITAVTDIDQIMITVQRKSSVSSSTGAPNGTVYEYEDVTIYYADESDLSGGTFYFKVKKSWLAENGYDYNDIVLLHFNEAAGEWEELETTFTGEDGTYYYYSAETPSFSWFAIAVSDGATIVPESAEVTKAATAAGTTSSSSAADSGFVDGDTGVPADFGDSGSWTSLAVPVLFVIAVIIVIAGVVIRKRKEEYPDWWNKEFK